MSLQTARDIPLIIRSSNTASERRITPSWTVAQLKAKLEPITGIPPSCQKLLLKVPGQPDTVIEAQDEDSSQVGSWTLQAHAEIDVADTRPAAARNLDLTDLSSVPKYTMPKETYSALSDSVLTWKKTNKLGRFAPNASEVEKQKAEAIWEQVSSRGIEVGKRCQLGTDSTRRGKVAFVGEVSDIPGLKAPWIGVILDEPVGKNDGSVAGKRYFQCPEMRGVFVRPERLEIGDFEALKDEFDENMEEV